MFNKCRFDSQTQGNDFVKLQEIAPDFYEWLCNSSKMFQAFQLCHRQVPETEPG